MTERRNTPGATSDTKPSDRVPHVNLPAHYVCPDCDKRAREAPCTSGYPCSFAFCQPVRECAADCAGVRRLFPAPRHSGRRGIVAEEKQRLSGLYPAGIPEQKHLPLRSKGQDLSLPHHAAVNCGGLLLPPAHRKGCYDGTVSRLPGFRSSSARRTQKTAIPDGAHPLCAETEHGREADALFLRCVPDTEAKEGRKQIRRRGQQKKPGRHPCLPGFSVFSVPGYPRGRPHATQAGAQTPVTSTAARLLLRYPCMSAGYNCRLSDRFHLDHIAVRTAEPDLPVLCPRRAPAITQHVHIRERNTHGHRAEPPRSVS